MNEQGPKETSRLPGAPAGMARPWFGRPVARMALLLAAAAILASTGGPARADLDVLWSRTSGGESADGLRCVAPDGTGGFIACGYTHSLGDTCANFHFIRTDAAGAVLWERVHGGAGRDYADAICATGDGGFLFTGLSTSLGPGDEDLVVGRLSAGGDLEWIRAYGGGGHDAGQGVLRLADGSFALTGRTASRGAGENDLYLLRIDAAGDTLWTRCFGGAQGEWGEAICETADGHLGVSGTTGSLSTNADPYLLKVRLDGSLVWERKYSAATNADFGHGVLAIEDGGMVLAGNGDLHGVDLEQIHLIRVDAAGNQLWDRRFGLTYYDYGCAVARADDGGFLLCGATKEPATRRNNLFLVKTDPSGVQQWNQQLGGAGSDWGASLLALPGGEYIVAGQTESAAAGFDGWLIRLRDPAATAVPEDPDAGPGPGGPTGPAPGAGTGLHLQPPNPFRSNQPIRFDLPARQRVRLEIVDVLGRRVERLAEGVYAAGPHEVRWPAHGRSSGVYYCVLTSAADRKVRPIVIAR